MSIPKENIIIIGGGIIGCTTAYYITHHPRFDPSCHTVTLLEASKLANGASGKAGGLVAAWAHPSNLAGLSFDLHGQLAQDHDGAHLWSYRRVRCGQLTAISTQSSIVSADANTSPAIELGKWWARDKKQSSLLPDDLDWFNQQSAPVYEEFADTTTAAQVQPYQFTNSMARLAGQRGLRTVLGTVEHINCCDADVSRDSRVEEPLTSFEDFIGKKVCSVTYVDKSTMERHTLPATHVVLAAGPWTTSLFPKIKIVPLRAHSVTIKLPRPASPYCLFSDIRQCQSPAPGETAKPMPLEIYGRSNNEVYICSPGDLETSLPPPSQHVSISSKFCQDMINAVTSVSDELRDGQVTGRRACYLPTLGAGKTSNPLVGQTELAGLVVATGHSCWGISNAPVTGKAITNIRVAILLPSGHPYSEVATVVLSLFWIAFVHIWCRSWPISDCMTVTVGTVNLGAVETFPKWICDRDRGGSEWYQHHVKNLETSRGRSRSVSILRVDPFPIRRNNTTMSGHDPHRVTKPRQRTLTCDTCRSRHQKCGGEQPRCSNCKLRSIACSYRRAQLPLPLSLPPTPRQPQEQPSYPQAQLLSQLQSQPLPASDNQRSPISESTRTSQNSISDADYDRLYSKIYGDIIRRLDLDSDRGPHSPGTIIPSAPLSNPSLPDFHREVTSIVGDLVSADTQPLVELSLGRSPDHVRVILKDSLPSQDMARHCLDLFLDYQNSIFYICDREEVYSQLAQMYESPKQVSIAWFCQMFFIFAIGAQFDDMYEMDSETYHDIGQRYMDDAIDENPQSTIWVIRAMLLLCIYQPPTKWNSVWMHLDAAIRGAQKFQLDTGKNLLKELPDNIYHNWRRLWFSIVTFDRLVAIFLGRLPRIRESISRDPILKDPDSRSGLENIPQNKFTTLSIISGNILRDMYFSGQPSLNICHQYKGELQNWLSSLLAPLQQYIESGDITDSPKDQAEVIFNLHFMYFGTCILGTRPFLLRVLKLKVSSSFASPIASAIAAEATLCIGYASRLINSATSLLATPMAPKKSFIPVFFLVNAAHIMILAAVWKLKQNEQTPSLDIFDQSLELVSIDSALRTLELCGHRSPFARKYWLLIKSLKQRLLLSLSAKESDSPAPPLSSMSSLGALPDGNAVNEPTWLQNFDTSFGQNQSPVLNMSADSSNPQVSYFSNHALPDHSESWPPTQFESLNLGDVQSYDPTFPVLPQSDDHNFWGEMRE
ncbi:Nucleotide-binding protein [Glarea lozoyensis ATCC 20868]|uniref:Nucleotide-binding protein n=1 Tax=Glarea lozoyensis (strain ATCC 20868 / MF5171) TaxID=1116229 RepID=S3DM34_GLAL2|nr:Nucleotide-binding protein [Glarea lozoyensis ATCC 20868]EPE33131.1 Nucleotide-binding protein [Glarea lozoyensis ATCC 20868]